MGKRDRGLGRDEHEPDDLRPAPSDEAREKGCATEGGRTLELPTVLIVEDDHDIRDQMKWALQTDYRVVDVADRASAVAALRRETPVVVLLDLGLPPQPLAAGEGLETLRDMLRLKAGAKVIIVTGNNERENALAAIEEGAYDFLEKPVDLAMLRVVLQRATYMSSLEQENRSLRERTLGEGFEGILGISPMMHEVFEIIRRVAAAEVPVLITGESGTGKELIARSIHRLSNAREGPFIAINCGAIPETLLESELFGHEKGSFTGADRQRQGKLELAAGGTLFLDEVGEMSLALQVKLLRFLQDGLVERVGGRHPLSVRTRVVAATHEDLKTGIRENRFREDLFYRLSVVQVSVPPLRDRGEDVVLIARALVLRYARELGRRTTGLSEDAVRSIRGHGWPGNVRELENRIKRAILMAKGPSISPSDLELSSEGSAQAANGLREMKAKMELEVVLQALTACDWNITHTAEHLRTTRQTLHFILKKYKLRKPQPKAKN